MLLDYRLSRPFFAALLVTALFLVPALGHENDDESERPLVELQAKIVNVVNQNMESCVAISDGMGFGSGVIVSPDGLILTAGHVVCTGDESFELFFPSGRTARARLVGYNLDVDAAMLRIEGQGATWPYAKVADATPPAPGSWTIGLGHSGGYELGRKPPVRTGRILEIRSHMLVTDSVLIGGDSGGPLFNIEGELIGIHSSIGDIISENRHVSMATFRRNWDEMAKGARTGSLPDLSQPNSEKSSNKRSDKSNGGTPARGKAKLGVSMQTDSSTEAVIGSVEAGGPAERVGLKAGDVILSVNGTKVNSGSELIKEISRLNAGDTATIEFRRNTSVLKLMVILDKF